MSYSDKKADRSSHLFINSVFPILSQAIGGGKAIKVEGSNKTDVDWNLDVYAGIDAFQILDSHAAGKIVQSIASRVQETRDFSTFTIRYKVPSGKPTEYTKRLYACKKNNCMLPDLTVQAYIDRSNESVLSLAAVPTRWLYWVLADYFSENEQQWQEKGFYFRWNEEGTQFLAIPWDNLATILSPTLGQLIVYKQHLGFAKGVENGKLTFI